MCGTYPAIRSDNREGKEGKSNSSPLHLKAREGGSAGG